MNKGKTVAAATLGCKVNFYDTEAMLKLFLNSGYEIRDFDEYSDIYIINTCSVTNLGDKKSRQMIRRAKGINPNAIVVAVGCYSQVSPEEVESIEGVNIIVGTGGKAGIVGLVESYSANDGVFNAVSDIMSRKEYEKLDVEALRGRTRAFLKIQDGCDKFCSYCIIPYARGRVKSRMPEDVLAETERFIENGYKEIVLTGIHVASYGKDLSNINLITLIKMIHEISGIERIRLSSIGPEAINEEFLDMFAKYKKICNHFHLSLQSGCDKTIKRMDRDYTTELYGEAVSRLRAISAETAFTTDIIVGFPGETEKDFQESLNFCREMRLAKIHVFPYSAKKGTKAAAFTNHVSPGEIKERAARMLELSRRLNEDFLKGFIGKETEALFEKEVYKNCYEGHTTNYAQVRVEESEANLENIIARIKITGVENGILRAKK